jgi:acyl carrier protein
MTTEEKVKKIIADQLGCAIVKPSARFVEDLEAEDYDMIEIILSIEEEFNLEVPDYFLDNLKTVGELLNYVAVNAQQDSEVKQ